MAFEVLLNPKDITTPFENLSKYLNEFTLKVKQNSITSEGTDGAGVCFCTFELTGLDCKTHSNELAEDIIHFNSEKFMSFLSRFKEPFSLISDDSKLTLKSEDKSLSMPLIESTKGVESPDTSKLQFGVVFNMKGTLLKSIMNDCLSLRNDHLTIKVKDDKILFLSVDTMGSLEAEVPHKDKLEDAESNFSLEYLKKLKFGTNSMVKVEMGTDMPMRLNHHQSCVEL